MCLALPQTAGVAGWKTCCTAGFAGSKTWPAVSRLWPWLDDCLHDTPLPALQTTDGEELIFHTATFSVDDPDAVRAALDAREDVDPTEHDGEHIWFKETDRNTQGHLGDYITLGRLELTDRELVLHVNSAERLARAQHWLTAIPGVSLRDVAIEEVDPQKMVKQARRATAPGGEEPTELTPEIEARVQTFIHNHYMQWLDTSIPALNDATPREASRTPDGRRQVAERIRTMGTCQGPVPTEPPRREMLAELGLADEAEETQGPLLIAEPAPEGLAAAGRVGRNAPCPCGSGRKYKKCCGR